MNGSEAVGLNLRHYRAVEEIKTCHILYVSQSEGTRLDNILAVLKGKPVLTVSDIENAAIRGIMIRLSLNVIRFD